MKRDEIIHKYLDTKGDRLLRSLNTKRAKKALAKSFAATPEALGDAAVRYAAKKKKR